jgi:hypothetical protein
VRAVFATDFSYIDHEGWVGSPAIRAKRDVGPWNVQLLVGPHFADRAYHEYIGNKSYKRAVRGTPNYPRGALTKRRSHGC